MALVKSALILVFYVSWVAAADYNDLNTEVEQIINKIRGSLENAWKWVEMNTKTGFGKIHEVFSIHGPFWQRRYRYQNVQPSPTKTETEAPQKIDASTQTETETPQNVDTSTQTEPLILTTIPLTTEPKNPSTSTEQNTLKPETQTDQQPKSSDTSDQGVKEEIQPELHTEIAETASADTENANQTGNVDTPQDSAAVMTVKQETSCEMTEYPGDERVSETVQTEPVIPVDNGDHGVPDSQITNDRQSSDHDVAEPEVKAEVLIPEKVERIEYPEHIRGAGPSAVIYEQQNVIILFLFFLMLIMGIYFFLLSRTQHHCPTIVIGDLSGSLKPTIKK